MRLKHLIVAFENLPHIKLLFTLIHLFFAGGEYLLLVVKHILVHHNGQKRLDYGNADVVLAALQLQLRLLDIKFALFDFIGVAQPVEKGHAGVDPVIATPPHGLFIVPEIKTL